MNSDDRLTKLEEALTHQHALVEDLNAIVTAQAGQIAILERRVHMLLQHAAESEAGQMAAPDVNQPPPHY